MNLGVRTHACKREHVESVQPSCCWMYSPKLTQCYPCAPSQTSSARGAEVCNTLFANLILREQVRGAQVWAVVGLVASTALVIANAPRPTADEEAKEQDVVFLSSRFMCPEFDILTVFLVGAVLVARSAARIREAPAGGNNLQAGEAPPMPCIGEESLLDESAYESRTKASSVATTGGSQLVPMSWAIAAAVAGGCPPVSRSQQVRGLCRAFWRGLLSLDFRSSLEASLLQSLAHLRSSLIR